MRAVVTQVCGVCRWPTTSKAAMDEHIEEFHGKNWAPGMLERAKDQMEFRPCAPTTPWGSDFRK